MSFRYVYEGSTGGYPLYEYEPEEEPIRCELCEGIATDKVDLAPLNPGRYVAYLCKGCAAFERARINREIKDEKLFKLKHTGL